MASAIPWLTIDTSCRRWCSSNCRPHIGEIKSICIWLLHHGLCEYEEPRSPLTELRRCQEVNVWSSGVSPLVLVCARALLITRLPAGSGYSQKPGLLGLPSSDREKYPSAFSRGSDADCPMTGRRAACICWRNCSQHVFESQEKLRREPGNIDSRMCVLLLEAARPHAFRQIWRSLPGVPAVAPGWDAFINSLIQTMLGGKWRRSSGRGKKPPVFA